MTSKHSPHIIADSLVSRTMDDWKKIASGSGDDRPFLHDLAELSRRGKGTALHDHVSADLKFINSQLRQQALMPNLEILGSVGGHILARDQARSKDVVVTAFPQGIPQVEDLTNNANMKHRQIQKAEFKPLGDSAREVTPSNVRQGLEINDCRLMARLASLAQANPPAIAKMIRDNHNHTYTVTFPGAPSRPVTVLAPTAWERSTFTTGGAEWTLVLGKAYRQLEHIPFGPGRSAKDVGGLLTGKSNTMLIPLELPLCKPATSKHGSPDKVCASAQTIHQAFAGTVSAWTDKHNYKIAYIENKNIATALRDSLNNHMIVNTAFNSTKLTGTDASAHHNSHHQVRLQSGHMYSILAYDQRKHIVTLRNPWGINFDARTHKQVGDGLLELPLQKFEQAALALDIEKTSRSL